MAKKTSKTTKAQNENKPSTPTAAKKVDRRAAWITTIEQGISAMEHARELAKAAFTTPVITNVSDPNTMAKRLSEKFRSLQFLVIYNQGSHAITAEPINTKEWSATGEDYYLERTARDVDATFKETFAKMWPEFAVVRAYAEGYQHGSHNAGDIKELQRENEYLRRHVVRGPWGTHPMGPFFSG
jgi:hypothetical protein